MNRALLLLLLFAVFICSCTSNNDFEIVDFDPISNFETENDTLELPMDLSNSVINGIEIPSIKQTKNGYFKISFKLKNNSKSPQSFYFKIFYQNETYKFKEFFRQGKNILYDRKASNNFYGSWESPLDSFHITAVIPNDGKSHLVTDSFKIVGNPRVEKKYFGSESSNVGLTDKMIADNMQMIKSNADWYKTIIEKAEQNNISEEEQLFRDALWVIKDNARKGEVNNRWKRNPRVGDYKFTLLVTTKKALQAVPKTVKNIHDKNREIFINPYFYLFCNKDLRKEKNVLIIESDKILTTKAKYDLSSGIYIDVLRFNKLKIDTSKYSSSCGNSQHLYKNAQFQQLFHVIDQNNKIHNVPLVYDVTGNNYTQQQYKENAANYRDDQLIVDNIKITDCPCETVYSDSNSLFIKNPGNKKANLRKENVGVKSRIGLTYGKYTVKAKFPKIINSENVWNGITCAFWLKYQDEQEWNNRTICSGEGYLSKAHNGPDSPRLPTTYYSEIDFEILKTSQHWPYSSYSDSANIPKDDPANNSDIMVTCTNWDLACRTPKNFSIGAKEFTVGENSYITHRWDDWYKALTIKTPFDHSSMFGKPYYYQIDWQPERIIWRIGESKDNLIEVGYMDNTITTIPDNQMVIVFSQEFHDSKWWPLSPFVQDMIPFPKNDIVGEILEIEVE